MCEQHLVQVHRARECLDVVLEGYLRLPVAKALDLSTPKGFDAAVAKLAATLRSATAKSEGDAVRAAIASLDVDWPRTSAAQRAALIRSAMGDAASALRASLPTVESRLSGAASEVLRAARQGARVQGLTVAADFNALDRRMLEYLRASETAFVRDEYGRRLRDLSQQARTVVADGLAQGLGRSDIAGALEQAAGATLKARSRFYWETIAGSFTGRGRSYGQLSAFAEAGIERYRIEAVLDENTTPTCRFLHGHVFTVQSALTSFRDAEATPEDLKEISPWVRERIDAATGRRLLYVRRGGEQVTIAEELRSGLGRRDDTGDFQTRTDPAASRTLFPPYHGLCRSSCLPIT